jgi:hypothetical protein
MRNNTETPMRAANRASVMGTCVIAGRECTNKPKKSWSGQIHPLQRTS